MCVLIRPPDIPVDGLNVLPRILSLYFRHVHSELTERNSTKIGHMVGSKGNLKTHVQNLGYPLPLQIGGPKTTFLDDFELTAHLTAYIFGTKHDIDNGQVRCKLQEVSYIVSTRHELWSTNGLKSDRSFYPPSEYYAFFFIAGLRTRTSNHRTQPNFATQNGVNHGNKLP